MKGYLTVSISAAVLLAAEPAHAAEQTVTLAVRNMTCASCPFIVKKTLAAVPGVHAAEVSFEAKTATVTFDDKKTTIAALTMATRNAGYLSTVER